MGFRKNDRVRYTQHITWPFGTVTQTTQPDDIRVSVLWDGREEESLDWIHFLCRVKKGDSEQRRKALRAAGKFTKEL